MNLDKYAGIYLSNRHYRGCRFPVLTTTTVVKSCVAGSRRVRRHDRATISLGRQNLKYLAFRQPGHEASDEEAQDTAEPRAPTDDDEHVRECEDERQRWGA